MSKQKQLNKVAIYMRLSRDDDKAGESMSIDNQRIILQKYVAEHNGEIIDEYVDDGWSGTNFDRPAINRLLDDAKAGRVETIIVKDLSRFGRNYIQVGQYIDYIFPAYGIRFIAINDNVDTADKNSSGMDMMPIMNVFNEWHAANTSKKIRALIEVKQRSGIYTSSVYPYGYKAGTDEKRTAVIDEEAANVVRRIFNLRLQGNSANSIARILTDEGIPNPAAYYTKLNGKKIDRQFCPFWVPKTVRWILSNPTYVGNITQHKTTTVSYKNHKVINVPKDEQRVIENAHEAIISQEMWDKVQAYNQAQAKGRVNKRGEVNALSGLVVCPDCGKRVRLTYHHKTKGRYFICTTYKNLGRKYCSSHLISENTLQNIVMQDIQSMLKTVEIDEKKAKECFLKEKARRNTENRYSDEKQLRAYKNRLVELDKFIQSAFEAKVLNSMPESVCVNLCTKYQDEKEAVIRNMAELEKRLAETDKDEEIVTEYIEKLKIYGKCNSLTRQMCLELISFISLGERSEHGRDIRIFYKFNSNVTIEEFQKNNLKCSL